VAYTKTMSFFVQPTLPTPPKTDATRAASLIFAAMLLIMVVFQLFSFEKFPAVLTVFSFSDEALSKVWAALIVIFEVATLPFLFSMLLSPAARVAGMVSGWVVATWWLFVSLWTLMSGHGMENSGLLGATFPIMGGWWMVFFCIGLGLLAAWTSWGMWPRLSKKR